MRLCIEFPDVFSPFRGEYCEDRWNGIKLGLWLVLDVIAAVCVSVALMEALG